MSCLITKIRDDVIGQRRLIQTPFGDKPLIYADYTASGRSLGFIEDYIREQVLPCYANTHTETNFTGARTSALRESARQMIRRAVNGSSQDKVVFCGSGATAAINKLIDVLGLRLPSDLGRRHQLETSLPAADKPVVFIGPYEHHSNELPWRESTAQVVVIPLDAAGGIDLLALENALQIYADRPLLIGSFSAASNVTGIKSDVAAVTALLKRFAALACWDYAAAGPYVRIDMNAACPLDAVFLSPHKFVGGPGTPGVLVAKSWVFGNQVPSVVGGGTVSYVTPEDHVYVTDIERREEAGTPAIVESIRAGLVFSLQQQVGIDVIEAREHTIASSVMRRLKGINNIEVLGSADEHRLPIFSLRFWHGGRELHYGFIVALLNDMFGIQVRGGCSCAGPYAHSLLRMDMDYSRKIEAAVTSGYGLMRPGWVRLNFNYFIADDELEYLLRALELVAAHGWRMLSHYHYDSAHGVWRHQSHIDESRDPLSVLDWRLESPAAVERCQLSLQDVLFEAEQTLLSSEPAAQPCCLNLSEAHESLRWFVTPDEATQGVTAKAGH